LFIAVFFKVLLVNMCRPPDPAVGPLSRNSPTTASFSTSPMAGVLKILAAAQIQAFRTFDICAPPCFVSKVDSQLLHCRICSVCQQMLQNVNLRCPDVISRPKLVERRSSA
jgi:hypothetical protein